MVGDGPEKGRLEARARELGLAGRVVFLGWRPHDEVLGLMARADAFVLPSAPEGFGLVYAEAMAQGTPVIACRGEGPDDFVEDGVSGLLVPPGDADAVARAIARLLDDRATAARLAEAGRAAVAALTWRRNAERQLEIYERVLADRPAADSGAAAMTGPVPVVHVSVVHPPDEPRIYERECRTLAQAGYDVTYLAPGAPAGRDAYGVRLAALPARSRTRRWLSAREIVAELRRLRPFVVHIARPRAAHPVPRCCGPSCRASCATCTSTWPSRSWPRSTSRRAPGGLVSRASGLRAARARRLGRRRRRRLRRHARPVRPPARACAWSPRTTLAWRTSKALEPIAELAADPRLRLAYIGGLSPMRGCTLMLDVMERLDRDDALLVLGGGFASPELERETMARLAGGLDDRVRFLGRVPRDEVPRYLASAEVVWNPMLPSVQYALPSIETKIYEGAAAGLAVLTSDLAGRTELVAGEGLGIAVAPTVEGHLGGVRRLIADRASVAAMGERGRAAVRERYSWEAVEERFLDFYDRVCPVGHRD